MSRTNLNRQLHESSKAAASWKQRRARGKDSAVVAWIDRPLPICLLEQVSINARLQIRAQQSGALENQRTAAKAQRRRQIESKLQGKRKQKLLWHKLGVETESQKHLAFERKQDTNRRNRRRKETIDTNTELFATGRNTDEGRVFGADSDAPKFQLGQLVQGHKDGQADERLEAARDIMLLQKITGLEVKKNKALRHRSVKKQDTSVKGLLKACGKR